ncbi:MAG: hypothetical protein GY903_16300 [Fuerstiella sp.]|nr:hypothetical protein [Fuerstiella sp.]
MVVVASANYDDTTGPTVVRIRNADSGSSFEMLVQAAGGSAPTNIDVHYTVMEEGVYDEAGFKLEAVKFNSTVTDENNSWAGQSRTYGQSYTAPVVVGQVMTYNDSDWSNFWARGSSRTSAPSASTLFVGKMVGEDADNTRADETIGYFVIETSNDGVIEGLPFRAGVGGDTVKGVDDAPAYQYSYDPFNAGVPKAAVVSMAGMDGGNGGWAMLYGSNPLPETGGGGDLYLAVDEDQSKDAERKHTTEQVAYFIIDPPVAEAKPSNARNVPDPVHPTQHFGATMFVHFHGGNDVLFGGDGNENLFGGNGADIPVGGVGKDKLKGGRGADLLISGQLEADWQGLFDVDAADTLNALDITMTEWAAGDLADTMDILGNVLEDDVPWARVAR